jgi:hypothetical protein
VEVQVRELEAAADDAAVARERALDLLRPRARRDVVVLGGAAEQQVAYATADQIGFETPGDQALRRADGIAVEPAEVGAGR